MSVFISGASGFIAQHIVENLLKENYTVIGSVRSQEKADRLTRQFGNNPNLQFEIVGDIAKLDAFDNAFSKHGKDIKYVLHTASPFHFNTTDYENEGMVKFHVSKVNPVLVFGLQLFEEDIKDTLDTSCEIIN